jgi:hypothetical protein
MLYPVVEEIAQAIKTRLETVTVANGYQQDVTVVRPTRLGGFVPSDLQIVLTQDDPTLLGDIEGANSMKEWRQRFVANCLVRTSDTNTEPVDTTINTLRADVEKALMSSETWWDGLATDCRVLASEGFIMADGEYEGVAIPFELDYRTDRDDPYTART